MSGVSVPTAVLHARTRPFDAPTDLLAALGTDGFAWLEADHGLVTSGVAARVDAADAIATLTAISVDDPLGRPGTGALAVGALPFDPAAPATLTVPARVVGRDENGRGWITEITRVDDAAPESDADVDITPTHHASRYTVAARQDRAWWQLAVADALRAIDAGELAKVVLAREVEVVADVPFAAQAILHRLRTQQPGCIVYAHDHLVGASPELLVRRTGRTVESRPLAGTAPPGTDADALAALVASAKDAHEHRLVVDAVRAVLAPCCSHLAVPEPVVERFATLMHLATEVRGELTEPALDALTLARRLHPTPAVGGTPTDAALAAIRRLEPFDRGAYAGPVGWVDARGDGAFAVALRGAELTGSHALLRAGAGIVAGSQADAEWAETGAKFEPMLRALIAP